MPLYYIGGKDAREDLVLSGQITLRNGLTTASTNAADWPKTRDAWYLPSTL